MNKIPFEYGSIAENDYFIDRIEDRRAPKTFLGGGIYVMLVSPRRYPAIKIISFKCQEAGAIARPHAYAGMGQGSLALLPSSCFSGRRRSSAT